MRVDETEGAISDNVLADVEVACGSGAGAFQMQNKWFLFSLYPVRISRLIFL